MPEYIVTQSSDPALGLGLDPKGERLNTKVVWVSKESASRFSREADATAFGDTFAKGAYRVTPLQEPAAPLRVMQAEPEPEKAARRGFLSGRGSA